MVTQGNVMSRLFQYVKRKGIAYATDEKACSFRSDSGANRAKSGLENRPLGRKSILRNRLQSPSDETYIRTSTYQCQKHVAANIYQNLILR